MSSSSTIFIALQCCQCSTMQVKQKKKSSNKWSCAVCNQKQSVRKVFAQGFMAKDIRKFVQDFNMSRKSIDDGELLHAGTLDPPPEHLDDEVNQKKKRNDWSAYLDHEDHYTVKEREQDDGDAFEPLVVTELPNSMFKKRRLEENSSAGSDKLLKNPLFHNSQEELHVTPHNRRTQKCKPAICRTASKWNDYLTEENGNFNFKGDSGPWNNTVLEAITSEQRVEDDIHPDFL